MECEPIRTVETDERVNTAPDLVTRFRSRADRKARKLNAKLRVPFYRHEVIYEDDRWKVIVMQNRGVPR